MGFAGSLQTVCVVWVGFDDGSQLGLTGEIRRCQSGGFMQVALSEHPEWQGDWQMPEGIEQVAINPKTGEVAAEDDPEQRIELFINGTSSATQPTSTPEEEPTPEEEATPLPEPDDEYLPAPVHRLHHHRARELAQASSAPRPEGHTLIAISDGTNRGEICR